MEFEERLKQLESRYVNIPNEIKQMDRWVCFSKREIVLGDNVIAPPKAPLNALNGKLARVNDSMTWTSFRTAIRGCAKYGYDGIGFMLGNGVFGVDLDNHADQNGNKPYTDDEFDDLVHEFVSTLNSYSEHSQSGDGVHIICKGALPNQANNRATGIGVEMYDDARYFAMTGNVINDENIMYRTDEVYPLWEKYLKNNSRLNYNINNNIGIAEINGKLTIGEGIVTNSFISSLSDDEIIQKIQSSAQGISFTKLFLNGDLSLYGNDHSAADMGLCCILAFWCNRDNEQIDRIFRRSALMREKWDRKTGNATYGQKTIELAIQNTIETYTPSKKEETINYISETKVATSNIVAKNNESLSTFDENGEPIIKIKKIFKTYSLDDTGNAERFYDQFGDIFHYNVTDKVFMIWTGKTWVVDCKNSIRKYANALIDVLKEEARDYDKKIEDAEDENERKRLAKVQDAMYKNAQRISNKAGKDAMLDEFKTLYNIPIENLELDSNDFELNTESGVVDLKTGEIMPFDKKNLLSKSTRCKVSYETPQLWLSFLKAVFKRENQIETEEIIDFIQRYFGYMLTGSTTEQVMGLALGGGSNGKSTLFDQFLHICGDYGTVSSADILMQSKFGGSNQMFTLSKLLGIRFCYIEETDESGRLAESGMKRMVGSGKIAAQKKFGNEFDFDIKFKVLIATNNKPIITARNYGVWRRIFPLLFTQTFTGENKDRDLPEKLKSESDKILGWCIQGCVKYIKENKGLTLPKCMEQVLSDYKTSMDTVQNYLNNNCTLSPDCDVKARELFQDYKNWARDNNEYLMKETNFGAELIEKGFAKIRRSDGMHYLGLKLNTDLKTMVFGEEDE